MLMFILRKGGKMVEWASVFESCNYRGIRFHALPAITVKLADLDAHLAEIDVDNRRVLHDTLVISGWGVEPDFHPFQPAVDKPPTTND